MFDNGAIKEKVRCIMKNLIISPQVYDDLLDIKEYISLDSEEQAKKVIAKILADMERIIDFPNSGNLLSNKVRCDARYRYITTSSYATIYRVEEDAIFVTNVLHLARDFSALKFL